MVIEYSRIDGLGLYLRFGSDPIVSFVPAGWGGVYRTAASVSPVDHITTGNQPVAFDVSHGHDIPWVSMSSMLEMTQAELHAILDPELARLGWPVATSPQSSQR